MGKGPGGRPPQNDVAKRSAISLRVTPSLREKADNAALEAGRSLSQEIELRLEQSFARDDLAGGPAQASLLRLIAASASGLGKTIRQFDLLVQAIEARTGKSWLDDPETFFAVRAGQIDLLDRSMPDEPELAAILSGAKVNRRPEWDAMGIAVARAVFPPPVKHPGHVEADGSVTPVAILNRG